MSLKLDAKRVEILFNEIKTGFRVLNIGGTLIYIKYPDPLLVSEVSFYEQEIKQKYNKRLPTKSEVLDYFNSKIRVENNIQDIDVLLKKSSKLDLTIAHFEKMGMTPEDQTLMFYLKQREDLNKEINKSKKFNASAFAFSSVKEKALRNCFETKISQAVIMYYIERCTFFRKKNDIVPLFYHKKFSSFNEKMNFVNKIIDHFVKFMSGYEEKELRALARSSYVTSLYKISNKTNTPIFKGSTTEYNQLQITLLAWCDYYHSIFSNIGAPERHIIDDDELFDKWVEKKIDDMKSPDKKNKKSNNDKTTQSDHKDVFIFKEPTRAVDSRHYRKI